MEKPIATHIELCLRLASTEWCKRITQNYEELGAIDLDVDILKKAYKTSAHTLFLSSGQQNKTERR